jgi:hypothetical protein
MPDIVTSLWFDSAVEEAAEFSGSLRSTPDLAVIHAAADGG